MQITDPKKIVISRTDSIGDVALTLPLAGILKEKFPNVKIIFLGNTYTKPIIECCQNIDEIWDWNDLQKLNSTEQINWLKAQNIDSFIHVFPRKELARLAKKAGIKNRIGTSHRLFHLTTCNCRPGFTRKNSDLHESQLNVKLLSPFGIKKDFDLAELFNYSSFQKTLILPDFLSNFIENGKKNIIFHPKSKGSAPEWSLENYIELAQNLDSLKVNIYFTGTEKEGLLFRNQLPKQENIIDLSGKMTLSELISFIAACDILLAASTGPLHLAGLSGINTIGLFAPQKPIHAGRWKPLGNKVFIIEAKNNSTSPQPLNIPLRDVKRAIEERL